MSESRFNKRILLASPALSAEKYEARNVSEVFRSNWIAPLGPMVDEFERAFAAYLGLPAAVALSSGTAALHLALQSLGIGTSYRPGLPLAQREEEAVVLCSALTFAASCNPIVYQRATPVFIDSEWDSWNMCPRALELALAKYKGRVKAVIVVHLYGLCANMTAIMELCERYAVPVIEDATEALGSRLSYRGQSGVLAGSMAPLAAFSFNGNKIITTGGGGMLTLNTGASSLERAAKIRFWATQARDAAPWYEHSELGNNYRLSNVLAAIGCGQLEVLERHVAAKRDIFRRYHQGLNGFHDLRLMPLPAGQEPNCWLSCLLLPQAGWRDPLLAAMAAQNVELRPIWKPMQLQPYYAACDFITASAGMSAELFERGLCLPSDLNMSQAEQEQVIAIFQDEYLKLRAAGV